jgi:hypothetical protein
MISKGLYLTLILGGFVAGAACFAFSFAGMISAAMASDAGRNQDAATAIFGGSFLIFLFGFICLISAAVAQLVLWYKAWAAIQDGHARTTPGMAVGLMFIPLFNLYWGFQAIHGFAVDYNKYIARHQRPVTPLSEGLYLSAPIMMVMGMIPFVNLLIGVVLLVVNVMLAMKTIDAINALASAPQAMSAQA